MEKEEEEGRDHHIFDKLSTYIPNVEAASVTSDLLDTQSKEEDKKDDDESNDNISTALSVVISKENALDWSKDDENLMISSHFTRVCHERPISAICYHPVMKRLLTCDNRMLRLWQMSKGDRLSPQNNHLELLGEVILSGMAGMCFGLHMDPTISCFIGIRKRFI